jgi:hypothetical protein
MFSIWEEIIGFVTGGLLHKHEQPAMDYTRTDCPHLLPQMNNWCELPELKFKKLIFEVRVSSFVLLCFYHPIERWY